METKLKEENQNINAMVERKSKEYDYYDVNVNIII